MTKPQPDPPARPRATRPEPSQPVSLRTLGDYLGLSPATVSLVLNDAPGVRSIPESTRERVREAAIRFNYRPSHTARALRIRQNFSIGVLVPELSDTYSALVLAGIEEVLIEEGYFYLTACHRRRAALIEEYSNLLLNRSVEGILCIDTPLEHAFSVPTVAIAGHRPHSGVTNIVLEQERAASLILNHLTALGHRNIAFMRGGSHSSDANERWEMLMQAARALHLTVPPEWTITLPLTVSSPELGYLPMLELLDRAPNHASISTEGSTHAAQLPAFTAIVCYNDLSAIGAMRALRQRGLSVPHDVSVIGFDDTEAASYTYPTLTTIRQPLHAMGRTAARVLLDHIRQQRSHSAQASTQADTPQTEQLSSIPIQPELIVRESTAAPRNLCNLS